MWINGKSVVFSTSFLLQPSGEALVRVEAIYKMGIRFRTLGDNKALAPIGTEFAVGNDGSVLAFEVAQVPEGASRASDIFDFMSYDGKPIACQICRQGTDKGTLVHFVVFAFE